MVAEGETSSPTAANAPQGNGNTPQLQEAALLQAYDHHAQIQPSNGVQATPSPAKHSERASVEQENGHAHSSHHQPDTAQVQPDKSPPQQAFTSPVLPSQASRQVANTNDADVPSTSRSTPASAHNAPFGSSAMQPAAHSVLHAAIPSSSHIQQVGPSDETGVAQAPSQQPHSLQDLSAAQQPEGNNQNPSAAQPVAVASEAPSAPASESSKLPAGAVAVPNAVSSAAGQLPLAQPSASSGLPPHVLAQVQQQQLRQQMLQQQRTQQHNPQAQQQRLQQHQWQLQQLQQQSQLLQQQQAQSQPHQQQHQHQHSHQHRPTHGVGEKQQQQQQQQQQSASQPAQQQQQQQQQSRPQGLSQLSQLPILQQQMLLQQHHLKLQQQARPPSQQAQQTTSLHQQAQQGQQAQQAQQAQQGQQAQQAQAASLQQQASLGRVSMQLLSGQHQQQPRLSLAVQPRILQTSSGWPVPLPKTMSDAFASVAAVEPRQIGSFGLGMKRSASSESGAGSAKKQKTALAHFQQAQEHMKAQQARQGAQSAAQKKLAEDMFHSLAPSLGPLFSLPSDFATTHAKEIEMALRSGLNSSLAWSLNALTVLSFNSQQPLLIAKHPSILQALLEVMVSGLDDAPAAVPPDPAECFTAAEALLPGKVPQPKPGEPQGWWWEREAGLLAPEEGEGWGFAHTCCACNTLRNLAMEGQNQAALAGQEVVSALIACLAACHKSHSADANLLASDALDVLHKTGHRLSLQELPPELPSALLRQLCQALDPHCSPLRIRITAAGVLQNLTTVHGNVNLEALGRAAGDPELSLLSHLNNLLRLDISQAQHAVEQELAGSFGGAEQEGRGLLPKEKLAMALTMQARCLADTAKTIRELAQGESGRKAAARHSQLVVSLIQLLLSSCIQDQLDWHKSTTRDRLKDGLHSHIVSLLKTALQYCTAVLITMAKEPEARSQLQSYELQLAEVAMTDVPQSDWIAVLLHKVFNTGFAPRTNN